MTKIELRYHHTDNKSHVYYKPATTSAGPPVLINQTLVAEHFRGLDAEREADVDRGTTSELGPGE